MAYFSGNFIQSAVYHKLNITSDQELHLGELKLINELATSKKTTQLNIFSLNHDLLIEQLFKNNGIEFVDGFEQEINGVRYFNPSQFDSSNKIKLYKLHGSINWFEFTRPVRDNIYKNVISSHNKETLYLSQDAEGKLLQAKNTILVFLTGTSNKFRSYSSGIFGDIITQFLFALKDTDSIVMSGYGWNDIGINQHLWRWINADESRKLILLHRLEKDNIREKVFGNLDQYDIYTSLHRLIQLEQWLSETTFNEVLPLLKH